VTKQRDFKALVRERMARTGERYAAARAQLLSQKNRPDEAPVFPGVIAGYDHFGGVQSGTAPLTNLLRQAGVVWAPGGGPFTETIVNGLCGGPGFLYAVFEYKGWPPILSIALQARSMPDAYIAQGLTRVGVKVKTHETASPAPARKTLDGLLAEPRPALCLTGLRAIGVAGCDGDDYWIDDRSPKPGRMAADALAKARAGYGPAKHRLWAVDGPDPKYRPEAALREALADTAKSYTTPPVPKSFWSNCGFAGLQKWQRLLTDRKDKKGWPTLFDEGARAFGGLTRTYEWIACRAAPGSGRAFYAGFLDDASDLLGAKSLTAAAGHFRAAAGEWSALAEFIAGIDDPAIRKACATAERTLEEADASGLCAPLDSAMAGPKPHPEAANCKLTKDQALGIYVDIATRLGRIATAERAAVEAIESS
jgi:hypothetical protein